MSRSRGHQCGDIELAVYFVNVAAAAGPVPLVLDLGLDRDTNVSEVDLTLVLMDTYTTRTTY